MTIQPLLEIMEKLTAAHRELLKLSEEETQALIQNDYERLNVNVNKGSKLVRYIEELERQRAHEVNELLISRAFRPDPRVTITDLIKIVYHADDKKALMERQRDLLDVMHALKQTVLHNQRILQHSLSYVNQTLELMTASPDDVIYQNPNVQGSGLKRYSTFDSRA